MAAAAIEARQYDEARAALEPLLQGRMTQRVATLMARVEGEQHGDKGRVREWLARAVNAPRDPAWTADGIVADRWAPTSPVTGALDAFQWRVPVEIDGQGGRSLASKLEELVALGPRAHPLRRMATFPMPAAPLERSDVPETIEAVPMRETKSVPDAGRARGIRADRTAFPRSGGARARGRGGGACLAQTARAPASVARKSRACGRSAHARDAACTRRSGTSGRRRGRRSDPAAAPEAGLSRQRGPAPTSELAIGDSRRYPSALTPSRKAAIAQLVEHVIRNDGVGGSSPSCGTSPSRACFQQTLRLAPPHPRRLDRALSREPSAAALAAVADLKPAVVVTGASRGIGLALARRFAKAGHDVALDRAQSPLRSTSRGRDRSVTFPCKRWQSPSTSRAPMRRARSTRASPSAGFMPTSSSTAPGSASRAIRSHTTRAP